MENNRPQSVSFFSIKRVPDQRTTPPPSTKDPAANSPGRTIVLFVDTLHLTASDALQTRQALRYFVDHQMSDQDLVALVSSAGSLGLLGQFTRDRQLLRFAIDRLPPGISGRGTFFTPYLCSQIVLEVEEALTVGAQIVKADEGVTASPPGMEPDFLAKRIARQRAVEILIESENKRRLTLLSLREVAERMAGMPGQRLIAYYTGGFTMRGPKGEIDTGDIQSATSRAVRSGVVIHSIDVRGLYANPIFDVAAGDIIANGNNLSLLTSYLSHSAREAEDGMNALAKDTGGEAFFNTNDLKGALQKALDEDKTYYALAYYPPETAIADKSFRRITLRVKNHPEYRIRTQRGYSPIDATKAEVPRTPQERLIQAIMSPLPVTEIGISASVDFFASEADKAQVSYEAHIDGQKLTFSELSGRFQFELELVTTIYDLSGKRVDSFAETVKANLLPQRLELLRRNGLNYSKRLALNPGLYQFRVGVRELSTDRLGATSAWVEVPDLNKGKLNLSNIFLRRDLNEKGQTVDVKNGELPGTRTLQGIRSYKQGEFLIYQLMIYNPPSPTQSESELVMQLSITRGDQAIYQSQWQALAPLVVKRDKTGIDIGGQFKLSLQPGLYELAIAIKGSKSKRPVQRTVAFTVEP